MGRRFIICLCVVLSAMSEAVARPAVEMMAYADSLVTADSLEAADSLTDAEIMQMLAAPKADTVKKVRNKGVDVRRLVNARRMRSANEVTFEAKPFMKNTFFSVGMTAQLLNIANHSVGLSGSLSFGKWFHEDHAVRVNVGVGKWTDNYDSAPVLGTQADVSYLFNISSFADGYRPSRFFDINLVVGAGYANSTILGDVNLINRKKSGHAFSAHVGTRMDFRIFKGIDFFIEPQAVMFTQDVTSYRKSWRGVVPAFRGTVGLTYNVMQSYGSDSPRLVPRKEGYFISLMGGPHIQNSSLVWHDIGFENCIGVHLALGVGKNYTEYFAMRYSFAFSRNPWVAYNGKTLPCNYFAIRPEGVFDVLSFVRHLKYHGENTRHRFLSASVVFGPELGYMNKQDREDAVKTIYMGVSVGGQAKFRVSPMIALFVEPRFSIVPYTAPAPSGSMMNSHRNYYDGIMNLNAGIELSL